MWQGPVTVPQKIIIGLIVFYGTYDFTVSELSPLSSALFALHMKANVALRLLDVQIHHALFANMPCELYRVFKCEPVFTFC